VDDLAAVLAAARAGDGPAFSELWRRYSGQVAGYLRAHGVHAVDDVTSEVFLAVFRGIRRFDGDGKAFRAWLFTIAHHRAVDEVRRAARAVTIHPYDVDTDPRSVLSAEDSALEAVSEQEIRALLTVLTPEQRDVLLLRFAADLAVEQCAAVMSRSTDAVKKLQRRAIARLRRELDAARPGAPPRPLAGVVERLQVRHD
jgi:RNA polymerase sigma-70 factor (ECF subfamily)